LIISYNGWILQETIGDAAGFICYLKNKGQGVGKELCYLIDKSQVPEENSDKFIKQELDSY